VFMLSNDHSEASQYGAILIKTTGQNTEKAMATVKNVWEKINPNIPFEPHFMDQVYEKLYLNEKRVRLILNHFTFLTLFISCLGLFGLATFITERLSKEIGIRKVLGATLGQIISRLSLDFIKWIGIAFILAVPVSCLIVNQMLKIYAYRTSISIGLFAFSGILILLSALLTVSYHSIKAATANPVESLRVE
jgi:putative ABC transport system permease protein